MPPRQRIPTPQGSHREANAREAAQLYAQNASVRDIAEKLGVSYGGAHNLLRYAGVTMRPRGGPRKKGQKGD